MKIEKIFNKYGIVILILWLVLISLVGFTLGCKPKSSFKRTEEKHAIVTVNRDLSRNAVYPIDPLFKVTLDDSSVFSTTRKYSVGDSVTYIIYTLQK